MRLTLITCWLTFGCLSPLLWAEPQLPDAQEQTAQVLKEWTVFGYAERGSKPNPEIEARQKALNEAASYLGQWLRDRHPKLYWRPTPEALQRFGLVKESDFRMVTQSGLVKAELTFHVTQKQHDELLEWGQKEQIQQLKEDRRVRSEQRHLLWGKLLGALVLLLALFVAYLRLEDATQGYLTRALRITLLAGVALTLAGLWIIL